MKTIDQAIKIVRGLDLQKLAWRHHGLGMLQGEVNEHERVHLWHPDLRTIPFEGYRDVHDHRFDLTSHIIYGWIVDIRYDVISAFADDGETDAWQIKHAKIQTDVDTRKERPIVDTTSPEGSPNTRFIGRAFVRENEVALYRRGDSYSIPKRTWHTTRAGVFAMTYVQRVNFDEKPARILGKGFSAIIKHADDDPARVSHETLVKNILAQAVLAQRSI